MSLKSGEAIRMGLRAHPPSSIPETPCGRIEFVMALLHPVDPETGEELPPLISNELAKRLLDATDQS